MRFFLTKVIKILINFDKFEFINMVVTVAFTGEAFGRFAFNNLLRPTDSLQFI